jgi:hypothetical protein
MECKLCDFKCTRQGELNKHNETKIHKKLQEFQRKLEDANEENKKLQNEKKLCEENEIKLQNENEKINIKKENQLKKLEDEKEDKENLSKRKEEIRKIEEITIKIVEERKEFTRRLQDINLENEKLIKEKHEINLKFLNEKRGRELFENEFKNKSYEDPKNGEKLKEEIKLNDQKFECLKKDFESQNSLIDNNSTFFKSNFSYSSEKMGDSSIENYLSIKEKNNLNKIGNIITNNLKIIKTNSIDFENKNYGASEDNLSNYKSILIKFENDNKSNNENIKFLNNEFKNTEKNFILNKNFPKDLSEKSKKILVESKLYFHDFIGKETIKLSNRNYYVLVKKKNSSPSEIFKYIYFLKRYGNLNVNIKFFQNEDIYLFHYNLKDNPNVVLKQRFYFSEIMIPIYDIFVATIDKKHLNLFNDLFKPLESSICDSVTSDFIGILLINGENVNKEIVKSFEILLRNTCETLGIDFINEFACSMSMVPVLLGFSKYNKIKNMRNLIYGVEKTLEVNKTARRCDGIYEYNDRLTILEYKMNVFSKQNPLIYINDRDYVKHLVKYLIKYENQILFGKKTIGQIGIEFYKDEVKVKIGNDIDIMGLINEINKENNIIIDEKITTKKKKQRRANLGHIKTKILNRRDKIQT